MPVDVHDAKMIDRMRHPVIATRAKLADEERKDIVDALRMLRGGIAKLQILLTR